MNQKFLAFFSVLWSLAAMGYIGAITFLPVAPAGKDYATTTLGFLLGTAVGGILSWAFDGSYMQNKKDGAATTVTTTTSPPATTVTTENVK